MAFALRNNSNRGIVGLDLDGHFLAAVQTSGDGISRAVEWCTTGRVFSAEEGHEAGLFRSIHPADEILAVAFAPHKSAGCGNHAHDLMQRRRCSRRFLLR